MNCFLINEINGNNFFIAIKYNVSSVKKISEFKYYQFFPKK